MFKVVSLMQILCNMWFSNKSQYLSNAGTLCILAKTGCNIRPNCWRQYSNDFTPNLKLWDYNISCVLVNEKKEGHYSGLILIIFDTPHLKL